MDTPYVILLCLVALVISLTVSYFLIKAAVKSATSEIVVYLKVLAKMKGQENIQAFNEAMREIQLIELEKKRDSISVGEYMKRQTRIMEQYS
jgi:hypothetical protein